MQKKSSLIIFLLILFSINFVSAQYGYYRGSLGSALDRIDPETIVLALLFIGIFAFMNWIFKKYFKDDRATAGVISFAAASLAVYGIYRTNFDLGNFFYDLGIGDLFYTILPLAFIGLVIYLAWKYGKTSLVIIGLIFFVISIFAYEKEVLWFIGIVCIVVWAVWSFMSRDKENRMWDSAREEDRIRMDERRRRR